MYQSLRLQIDGIGVVLYSPWAVADIPPGSDYLSAHLWRADDVARHVNASRFAAFGTGSPGTFVLHFSTDGLSEASLQRADFKVRLGLEVRDDLICVRDLYAFSSWEPVCPQAQQLPWPSGFYRLTVHSSAPASGVLGDDQDIFIHVQSSLTRPDLAHRGVPQLC